MSVYLLADSEVHDPKAYKGFVKLTGFTPKSRYIVDGSSTQIQ